MDGKRKGIDGFYADVVVTDGRSSGKTTDLFKVEIEGICKLKAKPERSAVVVLKCLINIEDSISRENDMMGHQGRLYFCFITSQGCSCSGCRLTSCSVL